MRPFDSIQVDDSKPKQRVGVKKLKVILPTLSSKSGCGARYSLCATSTTQMFSTGILIAEKTGQRSLKAQQFYERTNPEMQKELNRVIANPTEFFLRFFRRKKS